MKTITKDHKPRLQDTDLDKLKSYNYKGVHEEKMSTFEPRKPDYAGNGVAIWKATDKNGKEYLKVTVLGGKAINCFTVEEKTQE